MRFFYEVVVTNSFVNCLTGQIIKFTQNHQNVTVSGGNRLAAQLERNSSYKTVLKKVVDHVNYLGSVPYKITSGSSNCLPMTPCRK